VQHNGLMVQVVVFHSAYGLRQAEAGAAARLRAAGHDVITPDLYDGQAAGTLDAALALMDKVGWEVICARARQALEVVPETAVLAGFSMGARHFYTDPCLADYHPASAGQTWQRVTAFLAAL
jgi:dienelactone hydrolase